MTFCPFKQVFIVGIIYRGGVGVVPVEFVADNVLPSVVRLLPGELDEGAAHLGGGQLARLARHALLCLHLIV